MLFVWHRGWKIEIIKLLCTGCLFKKKEEKKGKKYLRMK